MVPSSLEFSKNTSILFIILNRFLNIYFFNIKEDTISINHNWFNGANVHLVYSALVKASEEIQAELRGFSVTNVDPDQLETILQCHHGMNFGGIKQLLQTVVERRDKGLLRAHSSTNNICTCDSSKMCNEEYHISNDRKIALELLNMLHDLPKW